MARWVYDAVASGKKRERAFRFLGPAINYIFPSWTQSPGIVVNDPLLSCRKRQADDDLRTLRV